MHLTVMGFQLFMINFVFSCRAVTALELMYLRAVTGSADGKIRIWNLVSGRCLRIMRGNSRSDPILAMIAIDNRCVRCDVIKTHNHMM